MANEIDWDDFPHPGNAVDDAMGDANSESSAYRITLRNVSVARRLVSSSQSQPCFELRLETILPGGMDMETACLFMDDDGFRTRMRMWIVGTALRHIKILPLASESEPGKSFVAAVEAVRALCAEQGLKSPQALKESELVDQLTDTVAAIAQEELDRRYPAN